jgi:hypothetical protein
MQFHGSTPFSNTTIFIGGNQPTNNDIEETGAAEIGTFFQTVLAQLAGGLVGGAAQPPLYVFSSRSSNGIDLILFQCDA